MADSPVFEKTCQELEQRTSLDRLAVRGTVRLGLKAAGLDAASVDAAQMGTVLRKVLPGELEARGIDHPQQLCEELADALAGMRFEAAATDRAGAAASTIARFGS